MLMWIDLIALLDSGSLWTVPNKTANECMWHRCGGTKETKYGPPIKTFSGLTAFSKGKTYAKHPLTHTHT